jgi:hypothetical protein
VEQRVFEKSEAPFGSLLGFIGLQHLEIAQPVVVEFVSGQDKTAVLPELLKPVVAGSGWGTAEAIAYDRGSGTRGRSAPAAMAVDGLNCRVFDADYFQALAAGVQRLLRISDAGKVLLAEGVNLHSAPLFTYHV